MPTTATQGRLHGTTGLISRNNHPAILIGADDETGLPSLNEEPIADTMDALAILGKEDAAYPVDDLSPDPRPPHHEWVMSITGPTSAVLLGKLQTAVEAVAGGFNPFPAVRSRASKLRDTALILGVTIAVLGAEVILQEEASQALYNLSDTNSVLFAVVVPLLFAILGNVIARSLLQHRLGYTKVITKWLIAVIVTGVVVFAAAIAVAASGAFDVVTFDETGEIRGDSGWLTMLRIVSYAALIVIGSCTIAVAHLTLGYRAAAEEQQVEADVYSRKNTMLDAGQAATALEHMVRLYRSLAATQLSYQKAYVAAVLSRLDPTVADHWDRSDLLAVPADPAWVASAARMAADLRAS